MTLADRLTPQELAAYIRRQNRERQQRYRADHKGQKRWKPFLGCDGEGGGIDQHGRQNFLLLRIGHDELFRDNQPLSTAECLEAILAAPAGMILVGYFFTYDATMILRDLPEERLRRLFQPTEPGRSPYTYWRGYAIEFRPKQYLRVARVKRDQQRMSVEPGSSRTINEVGGFFQKSFVAAISDWSIGTRYGRELIAATKERRSEFVAMSDAERRYCRMECDYLALLMTGFREACHDAGMMPTAWRGAGAISAALHRDHQTPKREALRRPRRFELLANAAYYGGRFEVTRVGFIPNVIHEYDISSAYPDAMRNLPCSLHTRWRPLKSMAQLLDHLDAGSYAVADVTFAHAATPLCNLPIRQQGKLYWPMRGRGVYWSPELAEAYNTGMTAFTEFHGGYYAQARCTCTPYDWIEPLYEKRKAIGKATRGHPLKLGLAGLYGKLAQRLGGAPYRDLVAAGLITALTRAKLIRAYGSGYQDRIVMLATDAVFATAPLPVDIGTGLGQWEHKERADLFIVQPGIYWSSGSAELPKTRGIPRSKVIERRHQFEHQWHWWQLYDNGEVPSVAVPVTDFIGHRLALVRGKPLAAGRWVKGGREISFDWSGKRDPLAHRDGDCRSVDTLPHAGHHGLRSAPYDPAILTELAERDLEMEADDDFYPWGNSGE